MVRRAITTGTVELLGDETVGGFDTLHLGLYGPMRSYRIDMWVNASTYVPIQATAAGLRPLELMGWGGASGEALS